MLNRDKNKRYDSWPLTKIPGIADTKGVLFKGRKNLTMDPLPSVN